MTSNTPEMPPRTLKNGHLLLQGGSEFQGRMADSDLEAIRLSGGPDAAICILPTAAALETNGVFMAKEMSRSIRQTAGPVTLQDPVLFSDKSAGPSKPVANQIAWFDQNLFILFEYFRHKLKTGV